MKTFERVLSVQAYGVVTSALFRARTKPTALRSRFERLAATPREVLSRTHRRLVWGDHQAGSVFVESVRAVEAPDAVILHLHGGAFVFGSAASYRRRAMRLSYRLNAEVFVPEYRLAPEHPYPAALDDALAAYRFVRDALRPTRPILVTGDSAGGGLGLSLLVRLRELGEAMPAGAILLSPWTDLSASGASVETNHGRDVWLSRAHLERWSSYYVASNDRRDPMLSPVFADVAGLPPLLLLAGEDEILRDDAVRVAERAKRAGTDARLVVGARMQHDWPLTLPWLEESREAWEVMRAFACERVSRA